MLTSLSYFNVVLFIKYFEGCFPLIVFYLKNLDMNKLFRFNDLYITAEHFHEIKAYLSCLAFLDKAL